MLGNCIYVHLQLTYCNISLWTIVATSYLFFVEEILKYFSHRLVENKKYSYKGELKNFKLMHVGRKPRRCGS